MLNSSANLWVTLGNSFNCDSQFGLTPGNIRNLGFICILIRVTFKGAGSEGKGLGRGSGKGGSIVRALEWETEGVEEVAVVGKGVDDGTGGGSQRKWGRGKRAQKPFFLF